MLKCWRAFPIDRPDFSWLSQYLQDILRVSYLIANIADIICIPSLETCWLSKTFW